MRLATYGFATGTRGALVSADGAAIADLGGLPVMAMLDPAMRKGLQPGSWQPLDAARLLPPIPAPPLFLAVGLNYRDHAAEQGKPLPDTPALFIKAPGSIAAPFGTIASHFASLDYEGELGIVIGRPCHRVTCAEAMDHIAGYVVVNDFTVRELIRPDNLVLGKSGPGMAPFGPWITTADAVDPDDLAIATTVNGVLRQQSRTSQLHRGVADLVAWISGALPLPAGTIIASGSPGGSGVGRVPPQWLVPGDEVRVTIEGLGAIAHKVVAP